MAGSAKWRPGPVIVARPGKPKIVVLGFHPALTGMRYELATPLLFANLLRWIAPEIFRRSEISGGSVGAVKLVMDQDTAPADVKVTGEDGSAVPFTMRERTLNFFSGVAGRREGGGGRPRISLLADAAGAVGIEVDASRGRAPRVPRFAPMLESSRDLWPWLALAGALGLLAEWLLYGRFRRGMRRPRTVAIRVRGDRGGAAMRHSTASRPSRVASKTGQEVSGGAMSFDHPWVLLALLLPLGWAAWEWRETARRLALVLKAAAFVCIVLALSGPRIMVYETKVAVAVLADTSASVSPEDLARASAIASEVRARARAALDAHHAVRARHALTRARREVQGRLATAPHRGRGGPRHGSGDRDPRRRGGAARGHGAAPAADLRRQ